MLKDKVALVTGGGTGIGKAIALKLAKNGAKVAIASRNRDQLQSVAEEAGQLGLTVLPIPMNIRDKAEVERGLSDIVAKWGALHILVNNAGISALSLMTTETTPNGTTSSRPICMACISVTKAALRQIPDQAGGRIINISSVLGKFGVPGYTAYCTTKHGMIGFTRALALEVVSRGITVNTICPGWVDTEMANLGIMETAKLHRHHSRRIQSPSGRGRADTKVS